MAGLPAMPCQFMAPNIFSNAHFQRAMDMEMAEPFQYWKLLLMESALKCS